MLKSQAIRTTAPPATGKPSPFALLQRHEKTIADRKVVLVVADVELDGQADNFAALAKMCMPKTKLSPISWPEFLKALPALDADIIFIASMRNAPTEFGALRVGLEAFRRRNPKAVVAMANAHMESGTLRLLQSINLLDHVEHNDVFSIPFLAEGVELFARRQEHQ